MKKDLRSLNLDEITEIVKEAKLPVFRAKQIFEWVHQKGVNDLTEMPNLGKKVIEGLEEMANVGHIYLVVKQESKDGTVKFLFQLSDGNYIECVLMRYRGDKSKQRNTLCVSSQVGCAMGCTFCATGKGGFTRNLTAGEILSQVYQVNQYLKEENDELTIGNIVFMGMGEPLLNLDNVVKAIRLMNDDKGLNISTRRITISTCGVVPQMEKLIAEDLGTVLAVSLHASNDEMRSETMPVNRKYNIDQLLDVCKQYQLADGGRISFEYALISGVNDKPKHADELADLIYEYNLDCHINLIPVNPVTDTGYEKPNVGAIGRFKETLERRKINCSVREEKGKDIDGACGQLRGKVTKKA